MGRGCCRQRPKVKANQNSPAPCKILEQGGASMRFWAMNRGGTYKLFIRDDTGQLVDVASFLATYKCNGSTARLIAQNMSRVLRAIHQNPGPFRQHAVNGVSLVKLLRTADTVLGSGRSANARRVHPFTPR